MTADIIQLRPPSKPVPPHVSMAVFEITNTIAGCRFPLSTEKRLQAMISEELTAAGIAHEREFQLNDGIIDLLAGPVGIEVKIDGAARSILRQIKRYAADPRIDWIVLVTNRAVGMPDYVEGKPVTVFSLGRSWL